jgi:2Fe-2S ferredoxin
MVQVTYVSFDGKRSAVDVEPGYSMMEGAVRNSVAGIDADCGGNMYCATCRVSVEDEWRTKLDQQSDYELQLLDAVGETDPKVRLSCQIKVSDALNGIVLQMPEKQK